MPLPFLAPLIGMGISGLAGLFGGRRQQQTQTQRTQSTSSGGQSGESYSDPTIMGAAQPLMGAFTKAYLDRYYNRGNEMRGIEESGIRSINQSSDIAKKLAQNSLASRGLSYSPAASFIESGQDMNRLGQITNFRQQMPMLNRQFEMEDIGNLMNAFRAIPTGQRNVFSSNFQNTSDQNMTGTSTTPGNMLGGLASGLGAGFGTFFGPGNFPGLWGQGGPRMPSAFNIGH